MSRAPGASGDPPSDSPGLEPPGRRSPGGSPNGARPAEAIEPIGAYLARQRKLRGISLEELEALTHIPRRSLERLESGVHDRDPDGFVRGFVRTVSAAIGLDPEDAVARMLAEPASVRSGRRLSLRRVGLVAAAGLAAAAVVALLPGLLSLRWETAPTPIVAEVAPSAPPVRWDAVRALADAHPEAVVSGMDPVAAKASTEPGAPTPPLTESPALAPAPTAPARAQAP